jgi:hypothetical protein
VRDEGIILFPFISSRRTNYFGIKLRGISLTPDIANNKHIFKIQMKKTIKLKLSFAALAFTLPLSVLADDSSQTGNMMATNSMQMSAVTSNTMNGAGSTMNGMDTNSMNRMGAKSMDGMTTNSMNSMSPPAMGNMNSGSMKATNQPMDSMGSGKMGMTNTPPMNTTNSMIMASPMGGH